jgi:Ca2+-binding RTX toxin-like protein
VRAGASAAFTHLNTPNEGAGAFAYLASIEIKASGHDVLIEGAQAQAASACNASSVNQVVASQIVSVSVDGKSVPLTTGTQSLRIAVGKGGYVQLNQTTNTTASITRAAAVVFLPGAGTYTIAQAGIVYSSAACAGRKASSALVQPCTTGSSYDPVGADCAITAGTKRPIAVGGLFRGPTGGRVIALGIARSLIKSPCLTGAGARYALLGIPGDGPIIGTSGPDRILAFGASYQIEAKGGNVCINAGGGSAVIHAGNGRDRIIGGAGSQVITVGNGNDFIQAGVGSAVITAGNGNDRILAGPGIDRITVGNGQDFIRGSSGSDQILAGNGSDTIYAGSGTGVVSAGNGNDTIHAGPGVDRITAGKGSDLIFTSIGFARVRAHGAGAQVRCNPAGRAQVTVNPLAAAFARSHGCTNVTNG